MLVELLNDTLANPSTADLARLQNLIRMVRARRRRARQPHVSSSPDRLVPVHVDWRNRQHVRRRARWRRALDAHGARGPAPASSFAAC